MFNRIVDDIDKNFKTKKYDFVRLLCKKNRLFTINNVFYIKERTAKRRPVPASRQASSRTGLARPVRVKRGTSAVPPLSRGIKTACPSRCLVHPSSIFPCPPWPSPTLFQPSVPPYLVGHRRSLYLDPRTSRSVGDCLRNQPGSFVHSFSGLSILGFPACLFGPRT